MSKKMKFETKNLTAENISKLAELFPEVVSEGKVNIDLLRSKLGQEVFGDEAYEFTWVGKREAIAEIGRPTRKTLRPCPEESRSWDDTENLYIEGDNLEVLKLLQESYLGKVKMIYIDPPYNTGNDFIYRDNFTQSKEEYEDETGEYDEDGDRLYRNSESNGRFHSDWCSMIYPRLVLARNLLSNDGVIFISIDDNEVAQLRKICDEVFGEENFVAQIVWKSKGGAGTDAKINIETEYILLFSKNSNEIKLNLEHYELENYDLKDEYFSDRGAYKLNKLDRKSLGYQSSLDFEIKFQNLTAVPGGTKEERDKKRWRWRWSKEKVKWGLENGFIVLKRNEAGIVGAYYKIYERVNNEGKHIIRERPFSNVILEKISTATGTNDAELLFNERIFEYPKPVRLISHVLKIGSNNDDLICDFFSGSATTAHAVMQLNAEDGGRRKFIMVQIPEPCAEETAAFKAGFKNICEIGKERIRRAGDKLADSAKNTNHSLSTDHYPLTTKLDTGFRVLKLSDSNMKDVYFTPSEYTQDMLKDMVSNIKEDRTDLDLLFGCLIEWGLPLSLPHTHENIDGFTVHTYNKGDLIACFDEHISEKAIREIAGRKPLRVVFRDLSFKNSPEKINAFEIFKLIAPNTNVRVI